MPERSTSPDAEAWTIKTSGWRPHEVGETEPNPWGLYDLHGNVFEWCLDAGHDYPNDPAIVHDDPFVPPKSWRERRIVRGGSWCEHDPLRAWDRHSHPPIPGGYRGFRVVLGPVLTDKIPEVARSPHGVTINLSSRDREGVVTGKDIRPLPDGRGSILHSKPSADWPQTGRAVPPEKETLQHDTWYDLLPLVDVERHSINGPWRRSGDGLQALPGFQNTRVVVPLVLTGDYELTFSLTRFAGDTPVLVYLPVGNDACTSLVLSNNGGQASGLERVAGATWDQRPPSPAVRRPGRFDNNRRYHGHVRVSSKDDVATIDVHLNGEPYLTWSGPRNDLMVSPLHAFLNLPRRDLVAIGVWEHPVTFHELRLKLVTGTAQRWSADIPSAAPQPPKSIAAQCVTWNGKPYWISPTPMNFTEALQLAHEHEARLLTVSSPAERDFLLKTWPDRGVWLSAWRNGQQPDPRIGWLDEKLRPLRYFPPWAENEPSSHGSDVSLILVPKTHLLQDHDPGDKYHAVLEWGEEE